MTVSALLLLLMACGPSQAAIDEAVNATRTADQRQADARATSEAEAAAAAPSADPTATEQAPVEPVGEALCPVRFDDLVVRSSGYLEGSRFMVTLQKAEPFLDPTYILLINALPYPCSPIAGQPETRVYCIGSPLPPVGEATVQLLAGDSSCRIEIPFETINVPPVPQSRQGGGSYY